MLRFRPAKVRGFPAAMAVTGTGRIKAVMGPEQSW